MDIWLIVCCLAPVWKYSYKGASPLPARNFRPLLGIFDFCGRRDFYRASPAVTLCLCSYLLWHCASAVTFCDTVPLRLPAVTLCLWGHLLWHCASEVICCDTVPLRSPSVTLCLCGHLLWHCASAVTCCDTVPLRLPAVTLCLWDFAVSHSRDCPI